MTRRRLPLAQSLTRAQYDGWACVWCRTKLWRGAVSAGIARGKIGAVVLDIEVYACAWCAAKYIPEQHDSPGDDQ